MRPILIMVVLIPGVVERGAVDLLRVFRQVISYLRGQVAGILI